MSRKMPQVREYMTPAPHTIGAETPLGKVQELMREYVAAEMAEEKYGCALVQDEAGKLIGIFTTVDACRALRQVLETFYPE